jgi:6,7-dimethyl-8-ribityllumazine synthase
MAEVNNSKLFQIETGILKKNACVVIVRTEWNAAIVDELEAGCVRQLTEKGLLNIKIVNVPGAFEIPFAIKNYWEQSKKKERPAAFIALACVLRGDTPHFDYVCKAITDGIVQLNLSLPVPSIFGVLTVENQEQANDRIGGKHGHKGEEAAITAMKMISISSFLFKKKGKNHS